MNNSTATTCSFFSQEYLDYYNSNNPYGILSITLCLVCSMSGIFWNSLIFSTVLIRKKLHTSAYILLSCFAFLGILFSLFQFSMSILNVLIMSVELLFADVYDGILSSGNVCSMLLMFAYMCLCFDQAISAYKPYFYSEHLFRNKTFYLRVICFSWLVIIITNVPLYVYKKIDWAFGFIATFIVLFMLTAVVTYTLLYIKVRRLKKNTIKAPVPSREIKTTVNHDDVNKNRRRRNQYHIGAVCMINMLFSTFFLLPAVIEYILHSQNPCLKHDVSLEVWLFAIPNIKLLFCPVFCCLRITCIRKQAWKLLTCKK